MDETERSVRGLFGFDQNLMHSAVHTLRKKKRRSTQSAPAKEIERLNDGYFIRPQTGDDDHLPDLGPEQLTFDFPHEED
jgi:hypothetical protein